MFQLYSEGTFKLVCEIPAFSNLCRHETKLTKILTVNVAQKTKGYQNLPGFPFTPELLKALDFVDQSLGKIVKKLQDVNLYDETLLIVASKHGQAPINPTLWKPVDPLIIKNGTKVAVDWQTVSQCSNTK